MKERLISWVKTSKCNLTGNDGCKEASSENNCTFIDTIAYFYIRGNNSVFISRSWNFILNVKYENKCFHKDWYNDQGQYDLGDDLN